LGTFLDDRLYGTKKTGSADQRVTAQIRGIARISTSVGYSGNINGNLYRIPTETIKGHLQRAILS
jgi:hypothetical protein